MAWFESLTLSLGASIAKHILKSWITDSSTAAVLLNEIVDFGKTEGLKAITRQEPDIDQIGIQVAQNLEPIFRSEGINFSENQKNAIAIELARTLSKAEISSKLLVECNLTASNLETHFDKVNNQATEMFSESETMVYKRLIAESCKSIIGIATELASFQYQVSKSILNSQGEILSTVKMMLSHNSEKSKEFEQNYLDAVRNTLDKLEMFGVPQYDSATRKQSLTIAYIALNVNLSQKHNKREDQVLWLSQPVLNVEAERHSDAIQKSSLNTPVNQLLGQTRRIVIRGFAGSGKTTLMKWIAVRSASRDFSDQLSGWNNTVPFFIPLREHVDSGFPITENFIQHAARMLGGKPDDWVYKQLSSGRAIVLIDGVDELPEKKRTEMLQNLDQLVRLYPFARYIVTSRPHALKSDIWPEWQEWISEKGFVEATLQPMSLTFTENFVVQWHKALENATIDAEEREEINHASGNLMRLLKRRPALKRLATNPLLCAMICALHRDRRQSLPSERIKLYQECVEMLISRREERRMVGLKGDYPDLNYSQQLALIQSFAYWLMKNGYSDVLADSADDFFDKRIPSLGLNNIAGANIRQLFVERSSLLNEPVVGRISFAHRTFQEYLAACAAVEEGDFGFLQKNSLDDQWQEVIILAAGQARPKERVSFLKGLIAKAEKLKRERNQRQIYLMTLACLETCVDLDPDVRNLVLEKATCLFPPKDDDEIKRIASAGDPAIELLRFQPSLSLQEANFCLQALSLIGSDNALDAISEYSRNDVFNGLGYFSYWENFDPKKYAEKVLGNLQVLILDGRLLADHLKLCSQVREITLLDGGTVDLIHMSSLHRMNRVSFFNTDVNNLFALDKLPLLTSLDFKSVQTDDSSTLPKLSNLASLEIRSSSVNVLSWDDNFPNLLSLDIRNSQIGDLTKLKSIQTLVELSLQDDIAIDLSPLSKFPNLKRFTIWGQEKTNLSPIANIPNLQGLTLENAKDISSLPVLSSQTKLVLTNPQDITNLHHLASLNNNITINFYPDNVHTSTPLDISYLSALPNLSQLFLLSSQPVDLSPIERMPNLTQLFCNLIFHPVGEKKPAHLSIDGLNRLEELFISNIGLFFTSEMPTLKSLSIGEIPATDWHQLLNLLPNLIDLSFFAEQNDYSFLEKLTKLKRLSLSSNLPDLLPLISLHNLEELNIRSCERINSSQLDEFLTIPRKLNVNIRQLHNLLPNLKNFDNIKGLDVYYENMSNLEPLLKFQGLSSLNLCMNWVSDISSLVNLDKLKQLYLSRTYISDISALSSLKKLEKLDISFTSVTDIKPIANLPGLKELNITETPIQNMELLRDRTDLVLIQ